MHTILTFFFLLPDIERSDPTWYQALVGHLNETQKKDLVSVFKLAEQRRAAEGMIFIVYL